MPIANNIFPSSLPSPLYTNIRALFVDQFLAALNQVDYPRFATTIPSSALIENYNWVGEPPVMEAWDDERIMDALAAYTYSVPNTPWANGIEVDRYALDDDRLGLLRPRIQMLAQEAVAFVGRQAITTLINGSTNLCFDGKAFFATNHAFEGGTAQSNLLTGTGVDTLAHFRADFIAARTAMRRFTDGKGRPMNIKGDLVVVPPDMVDIAFQAFQSETYATGNGTLTNPLRGAAEVIDDANLTDVNDWYLLSTKAPMKPLIVQERQAPNFTALDRPDSDSAFFKRRYYYGVDARYGFGYGYWPLAVKTTNT